MTYKAHLFICTNGGDRPNKCAIKGAEALRLELKNKCSSLYGKEVRINASGCLGFCEKGICAVVYPEGRWFYDVKPEDQSSLLDAVAEQVKKSASAD